MRHQSFAIAFVLGLIALPVACSDSDDPTPASGGASGSGGKSGGAGKAGGAGKGGTDGKGGTAGKGGSPGAAGEGGSGNTGNEGGDANGGMGGDSAGVSGSGGEGGQAGDPVAERLAKCQAICNYPAQPDGPGGSKPRMACTGDAAKCATDLCDTTGWSDSCVDTLDALLACLPSAEPNLFYCSGNDGSADSLEGVVSTDFAANDECPAVFSAYTACLPPAP
ncbi:MAG TPA: hypothetical protein VJV79_41005 [Polyangiaceae bacterium]|nr:hypothetical protein [Polyangiaceae bacterium]